MPVTSGPSARTPGRIHKMSTAERVLAWIMAIIILGLVLWSSFIKPSDKNIYQKDSNPVENHNTEWPLAHLFDMHLSCVRDTMDDIKK